jgi:protein ImuB
MFAAVHAPDAPATLLECAQAFSPVVELVAPHTAVLDAAGLERIFGHPRELAGAIARRAARLGFPASVAIARNPDAAVCAARGFKGISIVPHGDEAKFLAPLPLAVLEPPEEIAETLARWGIRHLRNLAALPERGLAARLGSKGIRLRKLARGEWERPLKPVEDPLVFEEDLELEYPVDLLEPLAFLLARLLNGLTVRLAARGLATNELRLRLGLEDNTVHERVLRLPIPMLDARAFLKLMQLDLAANPPAAPVVRITIAAEPVKPRAAQTGLFIPLAPEPEKLEVTLARLGALVGAGNVGSPELLDTHRPDAFRMRRFGAPPAAAAAAVETRLAYRVFRPPRAAEVRMAAGHPAHVSAAGIRGSVTSFAGPWRTSGDWWTPESWDRDEWDIALNDGALYRLFCDRSTGRWFVGGSYD